MPSLAVIRAGIMTIASALLPFVQDRKANHRATQSEHLEAPAHGFTKNHIECHSGTFEGAVMALQTVFAPMKGDDGWDARPDVFPTLRVSSNETGSQDVRQNSRLLRKLVSD